MGTGDGLMGRYSLEDVKNKVHLKLLEARQSEYCCKSDEFRSAWISASPAMQEKLMCTGLSNQDLKAWILEVKCQDVDTMPTSNLMLKAKQFKIRNYSRMPRDDLRSIIKARLA